MCDLLRSQPEGNAQGVRTVNIHFSDSRHAWTSYPKGSKGGPEGLGETKEPVNHSKGKWTTNWDSSPTGPGELATLSTTSSPKALIESFEDFLFSLWGYILDSIIAVKKENWVHFRIKSWNTSVPQSKSCLSILNHHVRASVMSVGLCLSWISSLSSSFPSTINVIFPGIQTLTCLPFSPSFS